MRKLLALLLAAALVAGIAGVWYVFLRPGSSGGRTAQVLTWIRNPDNRDMTLAINAGERCGAAAFAFPTDGLIGFLWDDSFRPGHRHTGLDIFGGSPPGQTPVVAAYDGYLSRLDDWKSTVIIRIPEDPLQPGRQIWNYYTHMADAEGNSLILNDFPPGTHEQYVTAGTLLGYQGNYSGEPNNPVGVHLHFSIVRDDGQGEFLNELEIANTIDPSPYFNLALNGSQNQDEIPVCGQQNAMRSGE